MLWVLSTLKVFAFMFPFTTVYAPEDGIGQIDSNIFKSSGILDAIGYDKY